MPPKRRARVSQVVSPRSPSQSKTPTPAESPQEAEEDGQEEQPAEEPWTDEEEIGLFKGLVRWKPTGIHKHFHILSLHQYMTANGFIHPQTDHTRPAGIWRKLHTLYKLDSLDKREDSRQLEKIDIPPEYRNSDDEDDSEDSIDDEDVYSVAENKIVSRDFDLVGEDFEQRKWQRRLATDRRRNDSPPLIPDLNLAEEAPFAFIPSFSIEPEEVTTPAPTARRGRPRARTSSTRGRPSVGASARTRRSTRQAETAADGDDDGEESEEDGSDESDEEAEEESDDNASAGRTTRRTRGGPSRAVERGQTKGRGRGRG